MKELFKHDPLSVDGTETQAQMYAAVPAVLIWCVLWLPSTLSQQTHIPSQPPPHQPTAVRVFAYINSYGVTDSVAQTVEVDYYLYYTWEDSRVNDSRSLPLNSIWHPAIIATNIFQDEYNEIYLQAKARNGTVTVKQRAQAPFYTELDLSQFWSDSHILELKFRSAVFFEDTVKLKNGKGLGHRSPFVSEHAALLTWQDHRYVGYEVYDQRFQPAGKKFYYFALLVHLHREKGIFLWVVFLPLSFIMLMSSGTFWIPITFVRARIATITTALAAVVAYNFVISNMVPKASYVTNFDKFVLWNFGLLFIGVIETIVVYEYRKRGKWSGTKFKFLRVFKKSFLPKKKKSPIKSKKFKGDQQKQDADNYVAMEDEQESLEKQIVKHEEQARKVDRMMRVVYPLLYGSGAILFLFLL